MTEKNQTKQSQREGQSDFPLVSVSKRLCDESHVNTHFLQKLNSFTGEISRFDVFVNKTVQKFEKIQNKSKSLTNLLPKMIRIEIPHLENAL